MGDINEMRKLKKIILESKIDTTKYFFCRGRLNTNCELICSWNNNTRKCVPCRKILNKEQNVNKKSNQKYRATVKDDNCIVNFNG